MTIGLAYNLASQITQQMRDNDTYAFPGFVNANNAYAVNGLNQYTSVGGAAFSYDANGNLTSDGAGGAGQEIVGEPVGSPV